MKIEEKIENLIKEEIEKMGYVFKNLEIKKRGKGVELIVTIDKKEGRLSVEDCARVSRKIDPILEKENLFEKRWYLTVSSPGLSEKEIENLKF